MEKSIYDEGSDIDEITDLINDITPASPPVDLSQAAAVSSYKPTIKVNMYHIDSIDCLSIKKCAEFIEQHTNGQFDKQTLQNLQFIFDFCFSDPEYDKRNIDIRGQCFINWFTSIHKNLSKFNPKIFGIFFRGIWDMDLYNIVRDPKIQELNIETIIKSDIIYTGQVTKSIDLVQDIIKNKPKNVFIS